MKCTKTIMFKKIAVNTRCVCAEGIPMRGHWRPYAWDRLRGEGREGHLYCKDKGSAKYTVGLSQSVALSSFRKEIV